MNIKHLLLLGMVSVGSLSQGMVDYRKQEPRIIRNQLSILLDCRSFATAHNLLSKSIQKDLILQATDDSGNTLLMHYLKQLDSKASQEDSFESIIRCNAWWVVLFFLRMHYAESLPTVDTLRNKAGESARDIINAMQNPLLRTIITELVQKADSVLPSHADMFFYTYKKEFIVRCGMRLIVFKAFEEYATSDRAPDAFPATCASSRDIQKAQKFGIYKGKVITDCDYDEVP